MVQADRDSNNRRSQPSEDRVTSRRDPFGLAVAHVRAELRAGRFVLGEQLMVSELAQALNLSATPIREALARLAGEGLIEERRGIGHFAWRLDVVDLIELYRLHALLVSAVTSPRDVATGLAPASEAQRLSPSAYLERTEGAFERLIAAARSLLLTRTLRGLADRLAAARRVEALVVEGAVQDLQALEAWAGAEATASAAALATYHERRIAAAPAIVAAMRSEAAPL